MNALSGFRSGVKLDITRVRHWTHVFRLHVLREDPGDVMASVQADNLDAAQAAAQAAPVLTEAQRLAQRQALRQQMFG